MITGVLSARAQALTELQEVTVFTNERSALSISVFHHSINQTHSQLAWKESFHLLA